MRHSGRTTRKIDEAIQVLFIERSIIIPSRSQINDKEYWRGRKKSPIYIIDDDYDFQGVQTVLFVKILKRLKLEHFEKYKVDVRERLIYLA